MINAGILENSLCKAFCSQIGVNPVPIGMAISTVFSDKSGDHLGFYLVESEEGYRIQDDGQYLSDLVAFGIPIDQGTRGQLLDSILADSDSYWDRESYEIVTEPFPETDVTERLINFISSLIRVRDLELLTREVVRSTFREDALEAMKKTFGDGMIIDENTPVDEALEEFPADAILRRTDGAGQVGAIYFTNSNDKLNEALLLQMEADRLGRSDFRVIALVENFGIGAIAVKRFQRAQNRSLLMPIFRGDENAAMHMIGRELGLSPRNQAW